MNFPIKTISEITINQDSKRRPLNDEQRALINQKGLFPYIGANNIMDYVDDYLFDEEILCVAEDGGSWGKGEICAKIYKGKTWVNNHAHVLTAKQGVDLRYVMHYLNSSDLTRYITGTTRGKLNKSALDSIQIPIPDFSTQQRVSNKLEKASTLREKDRLLLQKYDQLAQSIFYEMFGNPVRNEKKWQLASLNEVSELIQTGPFGSLLHAEDYISGGIPLVNPSHIVNGKIVPDNDLTVNNSKLLELESYRLKEGDVVMGRRGEMGRCALVTKSEQGWLCGTGSLFIRPKKIVNEKLLVKFLSHPSMRKMLEERSLGATMNNLNQTIVGNLPIILPSKELQNKYLKILANIDAQKAQLAGSLSQSKILFDALLNKAFS